MYSIWLLEYARKPRQSRALILGGKSSAGYCELPYSYMVLKGHGHIAMIDVGSNGNDPETQEIHEKDGVENWRPPENILAKIGISPVDVDTVFLTHAHYDHMDNMQAFKNANFIIQEKEIMGWAWAMTRDSKYSWIRRAFKSSVVYEALELAECGRMKLVEGEVRDVLPGIDLYPAYDGHTFASQIVSINNENKKWLVIGDLAYSRTNFEGIGGDGVYVPVGISVGPAYNLLKTLDNIMELAGGDINNVVIGHSEDNIKYYPSKKGEDGLWMFELALEPGEKSRL